MNTPVNFELAKLLKEKEFNEWCKSYYRKNLLNSAEPIGTIKIFHSRWKNDIVLGYEFIEHHYEFYAAPTIAEVVMWLYEKHGIWISPTVIPFENYFMFEYSIVNIKECLHQYGTYDSPKEACEAGIEYTLNNLI